MHRYVQPNALFWFALCVAGFGMLARAEDSAVNLASEDAGPVFVTISDEDSGEAEVRWEFDESLFRTTSLLQPSVPILPRLGIEPLSTPAAGASVSLSVGATNLLRSPSISRTTLLRVGTTRFATDFVSGLETKSRLSTDTGSLFGKTPVAVGVKVQRRSPVVNEPRVRGGRVGRMFVSGSYWVPARIDLDTMVSKIDSRIIEDVTVVKGPYSVRFGPGFNFTDVQLKAAPRFDEGFQTFGSTVSDYKANGEQYYGRQQVGFGDQNWGVRIGYGHGTGNDYTAGNGNEIPSSYNSRDWEAALGYDLDEDRRIDFHYLRLDQTNVELPGQAFDIDYLVTDGFELDYVAENRTYADRLMFEAWYNRTRFEGSAQRGGKRRQFPLYDLIGFVGNTEVDSSSLGYRLALSWGGECCPQLTAGVDLRYLRQELDEITSSIIGFPNANSPIPKSEQTNPGYFVDYSHWLNEQVELRAGVRLDQVKSEVIADAAELAMLGSSIPQLSLADILGSAEFDQNFLPWSGHVLLDYHPSDCWTLSGAVGYAERPPSLTELYAAQPFMFLLQNGLNTITGDPLLATERLWQIDVGTSFDNGCFRFDVSGFYAWVRDYITFENLGVLVGGGGVIEQVNLQYVNTERASLAGIEARGEFNLTDRLVPFATISYVEGRDHTRNGRFATRAATPALAKLKDTARPRGDFSGIAGGAEEPLPSIPPLESWVGLRLQDVGDQPRWGVELAARIVDSQDRVAASLLESPTSSFVVLDLRGYWHATDSALLVAGVENLTNRTYREHLDFRSLNGIQIFQPGANFYFGGELSY